MFKLLSIRVHFVALSWKFLSDCKAKVVPQGSVHGCYYELKPSEGIKSILSKMCVLRPGAWLISHSAAAQVGWFPSTYVEEEDWHFRNEWRLFFFFFNITLKAAQPPSVPLKSDLFDKNPETRTKRKRRCPGKTSISCPLTDSHAAADVESQIPGASRHVSPLHGPDCPRGPLGSACAVPPPSFPAPFLLTLSYYWWLHWLGVRRALTVIMFQ